jgi:glycosyltransferase involved in cell wall biosynthesis
VKVRFSYDTFRGQRYGGVSRYVIELHRGLLERGHDSKVLAGLHRNLGLRGLPAVLGVDVDRIRPPVARQALTKVVDRSFERMWAPAQDRQTIYHKTYFDRWVPPRGPTLAVTVYDMIHERYPEDVGPRDVTPFAKRPWCERADVVFAISARTAEDVVERFDLAPDRVVVSPLGVRRVEPAPGAGRIGGRPFVLYVGDRRPRYKNFAAFARAFARSEAAAEVDLVCFGGGPLTPDERSMLTGLRLDAVEVVAGDDRVLAAHYASARALVYPSLYEGFGLPPLEAMSHGCPVAAAAAGSIPEVVGEAAVLFDPEDLDAMAGAIDTVVSDEDLRRTLTDAGSTRVDAHPWSRTVELTIAGYQRAMDG